jgi:hypothetical protein
MTWRQTKLIVEICAKNGLFHRNHVGKFLWSHPDGPTPSHATSLVNKRLGGHYLSPEKFHPFFILSCKSLCDNAFNVLKAKVEAKVKAID